MTFIFKPSDKTRLQGIFQIGRKKEPGQSYAGKIKPQRILDGQSRVFYLKIRAKIL